MKKRAAFNKRPPARKSNTTTRALFRPTLKPLTSYMLEHGMLATGLLTGGLLLAPLAYSAPEGGKVIEGQGSISEVSELDTHISQLSQNLLMEFESFDLTQDESVLISQPNAAAWFVGNIVGGSPTAIFGSISANGKVALVNAQGIIFGETSSVSAARCICFISWAQFERRVRKW